MQHIIAALEEKQRQRDLNQQAFNYSQHALILGLHEKVELLSKQKKRTLWRPRSWRAERLHQFRKGMTR